MPVLLWVPDILDDYVLLCPCTFYLIYLPVVCVCGCGCGCCEGSTTGADDGYC